MDLGMKCTKQEPGIRGELNEAVRMVVFQHCDCGELPGWVDLRARADACQFHHERGVVLWHLNQRNSNECQTLKNCSQQSPSISNDPYGVVQERHVEDTVDVARRAQYVVRDSLQLNRQVQGRGLDEIGRGADACSPVHLR